MEVYSNPIMELLTKFSHCVNILQFFGFYRECSQLMQQLCKNTFEVWQSNQTPFQNSFQKRRRKIVYHKEFDEDFRKFLMQNNRFEQYELTLKIQGKFNLIHNEEMMAQYYSKDSLNSIDTFLNEVDQNGMVKFNKIYFYLNYQFIDEYNLFISRHPSIKPFCIFIGNFKHLCYRVDFISPFDCNYTSLWNFSKDKTLETNIFKLK